MNGSVWGGFATRGRLRFVLGAILWSMTLFDKTCAREGALANASVESVIVT